MLADQAERTAKHLLPNGKKQGHEWKAGNVEGERGDSLSVCIAGEKSGLWADFATGEAGDMLNLWQKAHGLSLKETLTEIKGWLGIRSNSIQAAVKTDFKRPRAQNDVGLSPEVQDYLCTERKLSKAVLEAFKIQGQGRDIIFPYWRDGELLQVKHLKIDRPEGKKQIRVEKDCEPCLFGWQSFPTDTRTLTLTEGEIDAMSLFQYGIPALSLPFGGGIGQKQAWLEYEFDHLSHFDEIYLCLDQDEVGQQTADHLTKRLGSHRCRIVTLPFKDANECLQKGISTTELQTCFNHASFSDPDELKPASYFVEEVIEDFYPTDKNSFGIILPWDKCRDKFSLKPDELSVITGVNGHGKSQLVGQVVLHAMKQGKRVCIASLELKPKRLLQRLTRQAGAISEPTEDYIRAIHDWYNSKLWVFDLVGTAKTSRLLEVFAYAHKRYGIDIFVIDSLMKCGINEDDYNAQKQFIEALCDFKNEYSCHIILIVHPRKLADESALPNKLDMKGSGAVSDLADNCFTVWRNKDKENKLMAAQTRGIKAAKELVEMYDCLLCCDKNRNGDWEGKVALWFEPKSLQYLNHYGQRPIKYVDYSIIGDQK